MDRDQQGGENTQISVAVSHSTQEKTSGATGGRGRAVAALRMRGTAYLNGAWKMQMRKLGPLIRRGPFCLSRWDETEE